MPILRKMQAYDLQQINLILSKAFTHALKERGNPSGRVPLCREEFLKMYLEANPESSFVLVEGNKIVAYCFSRIWGKIAWFGPLSVLPSEQGKGYGQKIVLAVIDSLKQQGAETIGLETAAQSFKNLGFYTKLGFLPQHLTVDMIKEVKQTDFNREVNYDIIKYSDLDEQKRQSFLQKAKELSFTLQPGLDYTNEIELIYKHKFGDALLIENSNKTIAFISGHTATYSQEEKRHFLKINTIQQNPELPFKTIELIADIIEVWALNEGFPGVYIRANTQYNDAFNYFLSRNYRIAQNDLRMTLRGYTQLDKSEITNFSKWE